MTMSQAEELPRIADRPPSVAASVRRRELQPLPLRLSVLLWSLFATPSVARPAENRRRGFHLGEYLGYLLIFAIPQVVFFALGPRRLTTYGWLLLYTGLCLIMFGGFHRGWGLFRGAARAIDRSIPVTGGGDRSAAAARERRGIARIACFCFGVRAQLAFASLGVAIAAVAIAFGVATNPGHSRGPAAYVVVLLTGALGGVALAYLGGYMAICYRVAHCGPTLRVRDFAPRDTPAIRELSHLGRFGTWLAVVGFLVFSFPLLWVFARTPAEGAPWQLLAVVIGTFMFTGIVMFAVALVPSIWFGDRLYDEKWRRLDRVRIPTDRSGFALSEQAQRELEQYRTAADESQTGTGGLAVPLKAAAVVITLLPYIIAVLARG